ncbi:MAG: hypothetical protein ACI4QS_07925 [Comamonas sp.]
MGKYFLTPATHPMACGRFQASFAMQRTRHNSNYCRVFRFDKTFVSSEAAYSYALAQGRL